MCEDAEDLGKEEDGEDEQPDYGDCDHEDGECCVRCHG